MAQVVPLLIIIPDWSYRPSPFYHCNDKVFYLKLQEFRTPGSKIRKLCRVAMHIVLRSDMHGEHWMAPKLNSLNFPEQMQSVAKRELFTRLVLRALHLHCIQLVKAQDVEVVVFYPIILLSCPASTRTCISVAYPLSYGGCALYIS